MSLLELPEEPLEKITHFLPAPDVLSWVSSHRILYRLGLSPRFWDGLKNSQYGNNSNSGDGDAADDWTAGVKSGGMFWKESKDAYLLKAHMHHLPAVRWLQVAEGTQTPDAREGHLCCRLGTYIVLTGGFSDDDAVYVKDVTNGEDWRAIGFTSKNKPPPWVYGATLTALDDTRAVRFGGFQAGGYSNETATVAVLHLTNTNGVLQAQWEVKDYSLPDGTVVSGYYGIWDEIAARAYHSANLLFNRYLLILGGMKSGGCCLNPMILDTATWVCHYEGITTGFGRNQDSPSARHGHSVICDIENRGRLLLFGGGDGSDLLRSGEDNSEVWELDLCSAEDEDPFDTMPWCWRLLHADQPNPSTDDYDGMDEGGDDDDPNRLRPSEKLNLGRCHGGYRVCQDKVLFVFGSGHPSTNSILGYNLARNRFFRPEILGPLPTARFSFASALLEELGYLIFHGGFSVQTSGAITSTCVLDLAPGLKREFRMWPVNQAAPSAAVVTDRHVSMSTGWMMEHIRRTMLNTPEPDRPETAARMLADLQATTQLLTGGPAMLLRLIATGQVQMTENGLFTR